MAGHRPEVTIPAVLGCNAYNPLPLAVLDKDGGNCRQLGSCSAGCLLELQF